MLAWCLVCVVLGVVCGVWFVVCGVWYVVLCGVWCMRKQQERVERGRRNEYD